MIPTLHRHISPRTRAFTLIELVMVIVIILILAGLLMASVSAIRNQVRILHTNSRMQAVLDALVQYQIDNGGAAINLQETCGLGGTGSFYAYGQICDTIPVASPEPPDLTAILRNGAMSQLLFNKSNYQSLANTYAGGSFNGEILRYYQKMSKESFDVMPPQGANWATTDWLTAWPLQWPETNWDLGSPGTAPPILRFPWGKPGQRIDGSLCDPAKPPGLAYSPVEQFEEQANSQGILFNQQEPNGNAWATTGAPLGGRIWSWSPTNANQTDWVTLNTANRSDGTPVDPSLVQANLPLPFDLGWCSPARSIQLLQVAGVVPPGPAGEDEYRTDRALNKPWNDAWGNPLIVVYAIYQPERYSRAWDGYDRRDLFLRQAINNYQFNRMVYLAVGAAGPVLGPAVPSTWSSGADATVLRDYWMQIRDVAKAVEWNESGFVTAPWKNIKVGKKDGMQCLLTAPTGVK